MRRLDYTRVILPRDRRTILKDNISWHLPFLSANTHARGSSRGWCGRCAQDGFRDLLGLHNQTVVTDARRGDRLNKFAGVYKRYEVPTVDNFSPDCRWVTDRAEGEAAGARPHLRRGARARGDDRQRTSCTCRR